MIYIGIPLPNFLTYKRAFNLSNALDTEICNKYNFTGKIIKAFIHLSYLFSPGIWWIGFKMSRSGSDVQVLLMYS
jgi:hypothetical protein